MDFYWTVRSPDRVWWLLIFVAALVLAMVVPLGRRHSGETEDAKSREQP